MNWIDVMSHFHYEHPETLKKYSWNIEQGTWIDSIHDKKIESSSIHSKVTPNNRKCLLIMETPW